MVVCGTVGLVVWEDTTFGLGEVVLTGGLVVRGTGLTTGLVFTAGTAVVWTRGLGVLLAGTGGRLGG